MTKRRVFKVSFLVSFREGPCMIRMNRGSYRYDRATVGDLKRVLSVDFDDVEYAVMDRSKVAIEELKPRRPKGGSGGSANTRGTRSFSA